MKKHNHIVFLIIFILFLCQSVTAQTNKQQASDPTIQKILDNLEQLNKKVDKIDEKFVEIDNRFIQIDNRFAQIEKELVQINRTLVKYEERFKLTMTIFTIFGSVFGFVILAALAVFGYFFNQLGQLIKQVAHIEEKFEARQYRFEDQLFQENIIRKLRIVLSEDFVEASKVADESAEYKTKSSTKK